jgi:hypothetical protein
MGACSAYLGATTQTAVDSVEQLLTTASRTPCGGSSPVPLEPPPPPPPCDLDHINQLCANDPQVNDSDPDRMCHSGCGCSPASPLPPSYPAAAWLSLSCLPVSPLPSNCCLAAATCLPPTFAAPRCARAIMKDYDNCKLSNPDYAATVADLAAVCRSGRADCCDCVRRNHSVDA